MTFHIGQDIFDDYGNYLEEQGDAYRDQLLALFDASPEGQALVTQGIEPSWTWMILDYAFKYLGAGVPEMDDGALEEILFQLIPEKVATEPSSAPAIVAESRAFWNFVKREFGLPNADSCLELLNQPGIIEDLRTNLDDPAQYGMAKSIVMEGKRRGFDMSTQEGLEKWLLIHNEEALAQMQNAALSPPWLPSLPLSQDLDTLAVSRERAKADKKKKSKRKMEKASRKRNRGK